MILNEWKYDPIRTTFSGRIYGHPNIADGTYLTLISRFTEWTGDDSCFHTGNIVVKLGSQDGEPGDLKFDDEEIPF